MMRVVLLTKRSPLGEYLQGRLADAGFLVGTVFEHRRRTTTLRRIARREGWLRAVDVLAYQAYERIFRAGQFQSAVTAGLGASRRCSEVPECDVPSGNVPAAREFIASLQPDVLVVHATGLLKAETFELAPLAINLHCGILPEYRGHDTIFWALAEGDDEHLGSTLHVIDSGADTGAVLRLCPVRRESGETDITVWIRSFVAGVEGLMEMLGGVIPQRMASAGKRYAHWPHRGLRDYLRYRRAAR